MGTDGLPRQSPLPASVAPATGSRACPAPLPRHARRSVGSSRSDGTERCGPCRRCSPSRPHRLCRAPPQPCAPRLAACTGLHPREPVPVPSVGTACPGPTRRSTLQPTRTPMSWMRCPALATQVCMAVGYQTNFTSSGYQHPLADLFDGTSWSLTHTVAINDRTNISQLTGLSCTSTNWCAAVGFRSTDGDWGQEGEAQPLIEAWDGTTWTVQVTPTIQTPSGGQLAAVSCTSPVCLHRNRQREHERRFLGRTVERQLMANPGNTAVDWKH